MKVYKAVKFVEQIIANTRTITVLVNDDPKMIATENNAFVGGWHVRTTNGTEVGFFQTLNDIELFVNN